MVVRGSEHVSAPKIGGGDSAGSLGRINLVGVKKNVNEISKGLHKFSLDANDLRLVDAEEKRKLQI